MKNYEGSKTLKFNWSQIAIAFWNRYPNKYSRHVLSEDILDRSINHSGQLVTKRLFVKTNSCPKWVERLMKTSNVHILEESFVDPIKKTLTTITRNLGMTNLMSVVETCVYRPHPENNIWTVVERTACFESKLTGLKRLAVLTFGFERYKTLNKVEILPSDAIVDAPSLVSPILLNKRTKSFQKLIRELKIEERISKSTANTTITNDSSIITNPDNYKDKDEDLDDDDEVQIIKVVDKDSSIRNETSMNNKVLEDFIKSTAVASLTKSTNLNRNEPIMTIKNYFDSAPGKMLISIGLSRALEITLQEDVRQLTKKLKKRKNEDAELMEELLNTKNKLFQTKTSNKVYKGQQKLNCPHCSFKSELEIEMSAHMEIPHQRYRSNFLCNWCKYRNKDPNQMIYHCFTQHKQRCYIEKPAPLYNCRYCPFDTKSKKKLDSHLVICEQNFPMDNFLAPQKQDLVDYPAITSKFILRDDIATYERILKDIRLASYYPNIVKLPENNLEQNGYQAIFVVPNRNQSTNVVLTSSQSNQNIITATDMNRLGSSGNVIGRSLSGQPRVINQNSNNTSSQILNSLLNRKTIEQRFGTLRYPQNQSSFANGKVVVDNISEVIMSRRATESKELSSKIEDYMIIDEDPEPSSKPSKGASFVICEICDAYIKDLTQLRTHMQTLHKVKLDQRTLESMPPLNCQKCQWRFFTDQGLERHLLGAHGLVTSNMRELAEKNLDSGRCTVCGRAYANKLVAHMKDVHKSTLRPAQLSYKCTACATSFNLYRLFEKHVFTVHSDSLRNSSTVQ